MVISKNSQLGLRLNEKETRLDFLQCARDLYNETGKELERTIDFLNHLPLDENGEVPKNFAEMVAKEYPALYETVKGGDESIERYRNGGEIRNEVKKFFLGDDTTSLIGGEGSSYYFICNSVYQAANLIKVKNFTGRTLKDINFGKYTYLMGKHRCIRFKVIHGYITGIYFDDLARVAFEWGIRMEDGGYYFDESCHKEFTTVMQVLTFVELGDIEVVELKSGRNNGAAKKSGDKVTNTSNNTVFVVDSSWNKITIRTDGFAVRGHFRLQPCGVNMADRKLLWIDAFEKHGYTRKAKAEIIHA